MYNIEILPEYKEIIKKALRKEEYDEEYDS